ncbi:MAG TPA: hypothetical protein VK918_01310 [Pyrinomonadaceae bacterium]|nr:hypothetical protein [Pyrinomonadaceae bacterium]
MGRVLLSFVVIGICILTVTAQTDREAQAEEVKTAVFAYPGKTDDVSLMLRSLVQLKGPIERIETDTFDLRFRTKGGKLVFQTIRYADVMYLRYGSTELNFIPPPDKKQHGSWTDINEVYPGTRIFIILEGDRGFEGWSNSVKGEKLIVLNDHANEAVEIERESVVAFYGLIGGYGGVKKNASKAAKGMAAGRDQLLGGIFVGAAALFGTIKSDGRPILIYSR